MRLAKTIGNGQRHPSEKEPTFQSAFGNKRAQFAIIRQRIGIVWSRPPE